MTTPPRIPFWSGQEHGTGDGTAVYWKVLGRNAGRFYPELAYALDAQYAVAGR